MSDVNDAEMTVDEALVEMDGSPALLCDSAEYAITGDKVFDPIKIEAFIRRFHGDKWQNGLSVAENVATIWGDRVRKCVESNM